ncbi:DUF2939 domain-containing protein [Caldimonas tepidiphila]|uniref:DUF2939 domain-containing protein n=1 Tax=Caldimonas tepidiphila TaxID=2315841 RepID=UPI000E5B619A|nr:DUF2939 domain-containing protein [Caldimonas tepidiphila]
MTQKSRRLVAAAFLAGATIAVGAYWHYSPYLAMHSMRSAAQERNAEAFNEKVDYPKLRESLKGQLSALVAEKMGQTPATSGIEALGAAFGMALAGQMVEAFIRPEVVMRAMQSGEMHPVSDRGADEGKGSSKDGDVEWQVERPGIDKVIVYGRQAGESKSDPTLGIVFERTGFANWKLTGIRLPATL